MWKEFLPVFVSPSIVLDRKTIFLQIKNEIVVEAPCRLICQLIKLCNGTRQLDEIIELLKGEWDEDSVRGLINELCHQGVLVDCRYMSDAFWVAVENPSYFPSLVTDNEVVRMVKQAKLRHGKISGDNAYQACSSPLSKLLERRHSVRSFSGKHVTLKSVINMLWSAYGEVARGNRTTPSAGALYPLVIHVALLQQTDDFNPGVYRVYFGSPGFVELDLIDGNIDSFIRAFADPLMTEKASGVIVISGSFRISGKKYGNRSMLYVPLEAGHVAQNIHLSAMEHDVVTVEIGGFIEELLVKAINLPKYYFPLTTVVFGCKDEKTQIKTSDTNLEVHWAIPVAGKYHLPFTMAFAKVSSSNNQDWSCGRAVSPRLAYTKAVSEATEWAACGCIPNTLMEARLIDLESAIDPRGVIKFHPAQYRQARFPFKSFKEECEYEWVEGVDELRGVKSHVLADCVYFPYYPKSPQYVHANSSGVAANPSRQQAIKHGTLELVERDAFMIAYLAKLAFPTILEKTLPGGIRYRIRELRKCGFKVWLKDYSIDLAPVVFVFAQNEELPLTTCAACANFDVQRALDHALMEVEATVLCRFANLPPKSIKPLDVGSPIDHGNIYEQKRYFQKSNFLVDGHNSIAFRDVGIGRARTWQSLLDRFSEKGWSLVTIPLQSPKRLRGGKDLHIIRSIVPGIIPISFGYGQEPRGMERIYEVAKNFSGLLISYKDMPKFPHPYT